MSIDVSATGHYSVCADSEPLHIPVAGLSAEEAFAHPRLEEVRELMRNDCIPLSCRRCFENEARGESSKRQLFNAHFSDGSYAVGTEILQKPRARMLSYRFGNRCNLACLMCSSDTSSAFNAEARVLDNEPELRLQHRLEAGDQLLRDLRVLYLGGGEPALSSECVELLDRLIALGHTQPLIILSSNGTMPEAALFEKLKSFRRVRVDFSIDGCGETFNLLRYPMTWARLQKNLDRFLSSYPHFDYGLVFTLNYLNAPNLPETLRWWIALNERTGRRMSYFRINDLVLPEFLRPSQAGPALRIRILRELRDLQTQPEAQPAFAQSAVQEAIAKIEQIQAAPRENLWRELETYVRRRAAHRGTDAESVLHGARFEPGGIEP